MLTLPAYLVSLLCEYLPALEADELRGAITAASAPHLRTSDRRSLLYRLDAEARRLAPPPPPDPPMEHIEVDPEKAAAWFAEQGIRVVKADGTVDSA